MNGCRCQPCAHCKRCYHDHQDAPKMLAPEGCPGFVDRARMITERDIYWRHHRAMQASKAVLDSNLEPASAREISEMLFPNWMAEQMNACEASANLYDELQLGKRPHMPSSFPGANDG